MKRLTTKKDWENKYASFKGRMLSKFVGAASKSFYFNDLLRLVKPYLKPKSKIIEIGCTPGTVLINLSKALGLEPYGVEYTQEGVAITKQNFVKLGYNPKNITHADFFDQEFQVRHKAEYDVVFSRGFIEHFDDVKRVIQLHVNLLKEGVCVDIGSAKL
ncbi:hypothetical protein DRJ48_01455 [Candidatus Woesearchaeota archaeon]|nr:MAG: hypothetical protein DRJ48_01455 [Candidatus Woesearchaeota archaeon]